MEMQMYANERPVHDIALPLEYRKPGLDPLTGVSISLSIHLLWHHESYAILQQL